MKLNKQKQKQERIEKKKEEGSPSSAITPMMSSVCSRPISAISTPRLTPLRLFDKKQASKGSGIVTKLDINELESKIKAIEQQITAVHKRGTERKLDKLEKSLNAT